MASNISFISKTPSKCPVCETEFYEEKLQTGRGRLIAGELTGELRRMYEPSKKYGEVSPLIYSIAVCPECYYSVYPQDFNEIGPDTKAELEAETDKRKSSIALIFSDLDFRGPREWKEGIASYYFSLMCYDHFPKEFSPTVKRGVSAIRAAWLLSDHHRKYPNDNYDYMAKLFYRKARFYYIMAVEFEGNGKETIAGMDMLGPDTDKNYGYDGVLFLSAYLDYNYGPHKNSEMREKALIRAKTTLARIFGMGKASKNKPSSILELAKDLHGKISSDMKTSGDEEED